MKNNKLHLSLRGAQRRDNPHFLLIYVFLLITILITSCSHNVSQTRYFYVSYVSSVGEIPAPLKIEKGKYLTIKHLPELSSENYAFDGWYIEDERIRPDSYAVQEDIILTAHWTGDIYRVTFTHSDNIQGLDYVKALQKGTQITLPKSPYGEKTGLEFKGWLCNGVYYPENSTCIVNGDITFVAFYAEQGTHTISYYNVYNGTVVKDAQKFADSTSLTGTPNPLTFTESQSIFISGLAKKGYTFEGWYTNSFCDQKAETYWKAGTIDYDIELYAKWSIKTYTIVYDGNAGTLINPADSYINVTVTYEDSITLPECKYELSGCEFVAWSVYSERFDTEFSPGQTIAVKDLGEDTTSNTITLYAHWRDAIPPTAPTNFAVEKVERNQITFSWTFANEDGLAFTRLSYHKKGEEQSIFIDFDAEDYELGSNHTYTVTGLELGVAYYFTLTSYDISGNSNKDDASCVLLVAPRPEAYVPELSFRQLSHTKLVISWDSPDPQEYPMIEEIALYIDDTKVNSYAGADATGDCYDKNTFECTVVPVRQYNIRLELSETVDAAGRTNSAKTKDYVYLSEPEYHVTSEKNTLAGEEIDFWVYSDSLGFDFKNIYNGEGNVVNSLPSEYNLYAECTPLDSEGNEIVRNTTIKAIEYDTERGVYIRDALEPETTYNVKVVIGTIQGGLSSYSYSNAANYHDCTTTSRHKAEPGYLCYDDHSFYKQRQLIGTPVGVVTQVNSFNEARVVMALEDISVTDLNQAHTKANEKNDARFVWKVPEKTEIEAAFAPGVIGQILAGLTRAEGQAFTSGTINSDGTFAGKYITQTAGTTPGYIYAFDIAGNECSTAQQVLSNGTQGTFTLRPFAVITNQE